MFTADGELFDEFYLERRIWVSIETLPSHVGQAFISAEDRRFFQHPGVDVWGILRALYVNLTAGETRQGGSTITQQIVKNVLVGSDKTYTRKLKEAVLARRLEQELTKLEILELYLNFVYLGAGNYGVEAAALDYFGVPAKDLNPGQAALLAGLVPAPSRYSPRRHPEAAAERRRLVLEEMMLDGYVELEEAASFLDDPVTYMGDGRRRRALGLAYASQVRRDIRHAFGAVRPVEQGLQVHTALDLAIQEVTERAVRGAVEGHARRQGKRGPSGELPPDQWEDFLLRAPGLPRDLATREVERPVVGDCFDALVRIDSAEELSAGPFTYPMPRTSTTAPAPKKGELYRVCATADGVALDPAPWAEGAAIVLEHATGRVIAMVGGYQSTLEGFVRATQARRQPGSSFKPYVYGRALLEGRNQLTRVVDGPISLPGAKGVPWQPKNFDGRFHGPVILRTAFAKSLNTVSVRLLLEVGADDIAETAKAMGVRTPLRRDPTLALGSSEVTLMDQVRGFTTIARMGVPIQPTLIDRVTDIEGREVAVAGRPPLPGGEGQRALPPAVAYQLADMMRAVVQEGTARRAAKAGYDRGGKTGTTNDFIDAWFIGFTATHTIGIWIGTDGTRSLGENETGGRAALPAWILIADALDARRPPGERLPIPDEAIFVEADGKWVGLARGSVPPGVLWVPPVGRAPLPPIDAPAATSTSARRITRTATRTSTVSLRSP